MRTIAWALLAAFLPLGSAPAAAQSDQIKYLPYLDDRSSPQTLVFSLYNAINRREFSRAYAYFAEPPAASLDAYASGFDTTAMVQIATGAAVEEGAAGSTYATLPIAIRSVDETGSQSVFSGCVVVRSANPAIANDDFRGWRIERTRIEKSDEAFSAALPECDSAGTLRQPEYEIANSADAPVSTLPQVIALTQAFLQRDRQICDDTAGIQPESLTVLPRPEDAQAEEPATVLASFVCGRGAYNLVTKWYTASEVTFALTHSFAEPQIDFDLGPETEDGMEGPVERIDITGWATNDQLINAAWDAETETITTYAKWRGIGDAFSAATYRWDGRGFVLSEFSVDPSFDGKQEPVTVFPAESKAAGNEKAPPG